MRKTILAIGMLALAGLAPAPAQTSLITDKKDGLEFIGSPRPSAELVLRSAHVQRKGGKLYLLPGDGSSQEISEAQLQSLLHYSRARHGEQVTIFANGPFEKIKAWVSDPANVGKSLLIHARPWDVAHEHGMTLLLEKVSVNRVDSYAEPMALPRSVATTELMHQLMVDHPRFGEGECAHQLHALGDALEDYSKAHGSRYPQSLEAVTKTVPLCPVARAATYRYEVAPDAQNYTITCTGDNHHGICAPNHPRFSGARGLES